MEKVRNKIIEQPVEVVPQFKEVIWGRTSLIEGIFPISSNVKVPKDIGEIWLASAHKNGDSVLVGNEGSRWLLSNFWRNFPDFFGNCPTAAYPFVTKILLAGKDLSVQVHPDDDYANLVLGEPFGKDECWLFLKAPDERQVILGHRAADKKEFANCVLRRNWKDLFVWLNVKKGNYVYISAGTVHGLTKGSVVIEVQQNSDTTFRLYDYDRLDKDGNPRDLHLSQSIDVVSFKPLDVIDSDWTKKRKRIQFQTDKRKFSFEILNLTSSKSFSLEFFSSAYWLQLTVLSGSLTVSGRKEIIAGKTFLIPNSMLEVGNFLLGTAQVLCVFLNVFV